MGELARQGGDGRRASVWAGAVALGVVALAGGAGVAGMEGADEGGGRVMVRGGEPSTFDTKIAPILIKSCAQCHGEQRQRAGLALHTAQAIKEGNVIVAGKPEASELVQRMRRGEGEKGHMPPKGQPQVEKADIDLIAAWVKAGAPFEGVVDLSAAAAGGAAPAAANGDAKPATGTVVPSPAPAPTAASATAVENSTDAGVEGVEKAEKLPEVAGASAGAVGALRDALVNVAPVQPGSSFLALDFSAAGKGMTDEDAARLIAGVREQAMNVSVARSAIGPATLEALASCAHLRRLNLSGCARVTSADLAALARHPELRVLIVAQMKLGDEAEATIASLPALTRVFAWKSGLSDAAVAKLRQEKPGVAINLGLDKGEKASATEEAIKLTSDRPLPGEKTAEKPAGGATAQTPTGTVAVSVVLAPINTVCPVTGKPVNPKYVVLYEGKLVGFADEKAALAFWAEPGKYPVK